MKNYEFIEDEEQQIFNIYDPVLNMVLVLQYADAHEFKELVATGRDVDSVLKLLGYQIIDWN